MIKILKTTIKKVLAKAGFTRGENVYASKQYGKVDVFSTMHMDETNPEYVVTHIRILSHEIEKGFSLPHPRNGFGKAKIQKLDHLLDVYEKRFWGADMQAYENAVRSVAYYIQNANQYELDVSFLTNKRYDIELQPGLCGVKTESRDVFLKHLNDSFDMFSTSRHSVRSFAPEKLRTEDIKKVIHLAQTAPSACNRQSVKIFHIASREICQKLLEIQGGAKGFSPVEDIFVVSADLSSYIGTYEANTCFVDCGLFAMNLLYSLHYLGIGACPLIWNDESERGVELRKLVKIPEKYEVALIIPAGYYEDNVTYAISARKNIEGVYQTV